MNTHSVSSCDRTSSSNFSLPQNTNQESIHYSKSQRIVIRRQIARLLQQDYSPSAISRLLGVSRPTVYLWKKRIETEGFSSIFNEKKRPGRPQKLTPQLIQNILADIQKAHSETGKYSIQTIAQQHHISSSSVRLIWNRHGTNLKKCKVINNKKPPITLREFSRLSGFSVSTLSLALRNNPQISISTRNYIQQSAKQLHYYPDPSLARLSNRRWKKHFKPNNIAFLCDSDEINLHPFLKKWAEKFGYTFEHFSPHRFSSYQTLNRILLYRGIQGIVLHRVHNPNKLKKELNWKHFSLVSCFQHDHFTHKIGMDYYDKFYTTWKKIESYHYRKIGFLTLKTHSKVFSQNTLSMFYLCQNQIPASRRIPLFAGNPLELQSQFKKWVNRYQPDCLLLSPAFNDIPFTDMGYQIPQDFALATIHRNPFTSPFLAGAESPLDKIAQESITLLDTQIRNNQFGLPQNLFQHYVSHNWHGGASLPPHSHAVE